MLFRLPILHHAPGGPIRRGGSRSNRFPALRGFAGAVMTDPLFWFPV
jgi:hypothetical protein